ncbi:outer membrane beta-barrel protein [Desulfosarcina variabilis]|uniref:outer membrane beta-barrel protein n=1 Tax=Desulfosarcina variabilis TaxID=2300 RepID=UPI003AFA9C20
MAENIKLSPEVILREVYSDNIYLVDDEKTDDYITSVLPNMGMQIAFTPRSRVELLYLGRFDIYNTADNFRQDHHYGHLNFQLDTPKGSSVNLGAWGEDSANQPDSTEDRSKDYSIHALYADVDLMVFSATELFGTYQRSSRRFDDTIDRDDDFDRDFFAIGLVNSQSSLFPLLLEYRYETQENDQPATGSTDFVYQAAYTGFKWRQDQRLSGSLRVGYLWSEFNSASAYDGWVTDTDLKYALSDFTRITGTAYRGVRESTRSARDTLDYYIYAGGKLSIAYSRLDPFRFRIYGRYENKDYRLTEASVDSREDDLYSAGVSAQYNIEDWLSISLGYLYRMNDSSVETQKYKENRVFAELIVLSNGNMRHKRLPRSIDQIDYFKP